MTNFSLIALRHLRGRIARDRGNFDPPCEDCGGEVLDIGDELDLCPECRAERLAEEAEAHADALAGK